MRRLVVSDASGRIIATGPHPEDVPEMRGKFGFAALEGQHVHAVELPPSVQTVGQLQELHKTHTVRVVGKGAELVPIR